MTHTNRSNAPGMGAADAAGPPISLLAGLCRECVDGRLRQADALLERAIRAEVERGAFRDLALAAIHALRALTLECDRLKQCIAATRGELRRRHTGGSSR